MDTSDLVLFATAMFAMLNPIGSVAIFASMVSDRTAADRRAIGIKCGFAIGLILVGSAWIGGPVLSLLGIEIPSLQVAGGIMIAVISMSMLSSQQSSIHDSAEDSKSSGTAPDIAVVPLAMPMIAGPGSIVTVIVNSHRYPGVQNSLELSLVCVALAGLLTVCLLAVGPITRLLGVKGMAIVTKFMGLMLLAIAMSMLASGLKGLLPGLAG